jgi:hypothetical protein
MRKAERISPSNKGLSHLSFCACVPYLAMTSMFPVSGAAQLVASEAVRLLPKYSAMRPYSRLLKPAPSLKWFFGKNMFHSPSSLARFLRSSMMAGWPLKRSAVESPICCWNTVSAGIHSSSTNFSTWRTFLSVIDAMIWAWQAYNVEVLQCLLADKGPGNLRDLLRCLELAISADHQLLREVVLLLLFRHVDMQYRAGIVADRNSPSCNLIKSIFRPRWTLNIAENGEAFCGGAEASSHNHLILLGHHALLRGRVLALALSTIALLGFDGREASFVMCMA